ncbi:MAG TPA: VOC family protein [Candidatus Acidoferrales bacterium]|nr:VOC family protein [Candidatus Acidoferrales bacterium]
MGKLRHIAFISPEPKKLSDFYQKYFGLEEVKVFPSGSRMVIDGLFNLAFLQQHPGTAAAVVGTHRSDGSEANQIQGIAHYGFMVDSLDEAVAKLPQSLDRGKSPQISGGVSGPEAARPAEVRFIDPWGNNVDISSRGFLGREEKRLPGVRLAVVQVADPEKACEFYKSQFDLEVVERKSDGSILLSDGTVKLMLTPKQTLDRGGIQYFGIQVDDLPAVRQRLVDGGVQVSSVDGAPNQIRINDPEGNQVVISA